MNISKVTTLTSGVVAIAKDVKRNSQESLDIKIVKACSDHQEKILVADVDSKKISNYDEVVQSIYNSGFGVVISDVFTDIFSAKALDYGILTVEVSKEFLNKIFKASTESELRLFIDFSGQEVMIVNTGEKEYFELSDFNKDSFEGGNNDVENLYDIWDEIGSIYEPDELLAYVEGNC